MRAPRGVSNPNCSASVGVTRWIWMPSQPRMTRPWSRNCATTAFAWLIGMEKLMLGEPVWK